MKRTLIVLAAITVLTTAVSPSFAAAYVEIVPFSKMNEGTTHTKQYGFDISGQTSYHAMYSSSTIAKVTNLDGSQIKTTLVDNATWLALSGKPSFTTWHGFGLSGTDILFADSSSDQVYKVDTTTTNSITVYASKADIMAETGQTSSQILSPQTVNPTNGEYVFYEGKSDCILKTNGAGVVQTFISDTELAAVAGNDRVSGGITFDSAGDLFWGSNTSDAMYKWDTSASSGSTILTTTNITDVTGGATVSFGDLYAAPDGLIYFYDLTSDGIMSFNPADAAGTLAYVLTEAELLAGPAGSDNVSCMGWYDGDLAFVAKWDGLYAVPEPMTMSLLGLGGLALLRRRRRKA